MLIPKPASIKFNTGNLRTNKTKGKNSIAETVKGAFNNEKSKDRLTMLAKKKERGIYKTPRVRK
jgi:hypothetical protein